MMDLAAERKVLDSNNNASNDNNKIGNTDNPQEIPDSSSSFASDGNGNPDKGAEERQAPDLKDGLHPLKHKFVLWYTQRTPGVRSQTSYEDNIKKIADFSVEGFWVCYCHLARPSSLPIPTDLHPYKEGIRPLCEDPANCNGGKFLPCGGNHLEYGNDICGAVLSILFNEDILSVWNCKASNNQAVMTLRDSIKRHLKLPHGYVMEYKPHDASLRDNSS